MAITTPGRLGITRWSADSDAFNRSQMDDSHAALENKVAVFLTGLDTDLGSYSAATYVKSFFYATNTAVLYFSNGTSWQNLTSFGTTISTSTPDVTSSSGGSAGTAARSDHVHAMPGWGVVGEMATVQTTASAGSTAKFARIDHVHVLAANSVTSGKIAAGAISSSAAFVAGVVDEAAIGAGAVTRSRIEESQRIPSGSIMAFAGTSAPSGWVLCTGQAVSRTTYSALFAAIGTRYGNGDGSTTFNVPDFQDRILRGCATPAASVVSEGADSVTIAEGNLPNHTHSAGTIAVATHADHVHLLNGSGAGAATANASHSHVMTHTHAAEVANGSVSVSGSTFGVALGLNGGAAGAGNTDGGLFPDYWSGGPSPIPVEYGAPALVAKGVTVVNFTGSTNSDNASHSHSVTGSTAGVTAPALSHTVSGNTGNPTGTVGTLLSVKPKSTTVNYIIKT